MPNRKTLFLFEAVTAGIGEYQALATEAIAMVNTLGTHLQDSIDADVNVLCAPQYWDQIKSSLKLTRSQENPKELIAQFDLLCQTSDHLIIIAPELRRELERWTRRAEPYAERLWTPLSPFVKVASDKWLSYRYLVHHGVPTPHTLLLRHNPSFESLHDLSSMVVAAHSETLISKIPFGFPWIVKPRHGAGSCGVQLVEDVAAFHEWLTTLRASDATHRDPDWPGSDWLVQPRICGASLSVNVIMGPSQTVALPASWQRLKSHHDFRYIGSEFPVPQDWQRLVSSVANRSLMALPSPYGLCGVDLVVDDNENPRTAWVVDINPRVTTSVAGLCGCLTPKFGTILEKVMNGQSVAPDSLQVRPCQSGADGTVHPLIPSDRNSGYAP